jgi:hypothetical protein
MRRYKVRVGEREFDVDLLERRATVLKFSVTGKRYTVEVNPIIATRAAESAAPVAVPRETHRSRPGATGEVVTVRWR